MQRENYDNQEPQDNLQSNQKGPRSGKRGFAAMDPELQKQIASKGGKTAHERGVAHQFTTEEAREAGRKGGEIVSRDRNHMAEIGRKGGEVSGGNRNRNRSDSEES
jgi:uncharacterized protein